MKDGRVCGGCLEDMLRDERPWSAGLPYQVKGKGPGCDSDKLVPFAGQPVDLDEAAPEQEDRIGRLVGREDRPSPLEIAASPARLDCGELGVGQRIEPPELTQTASPVLAQPGLLRTWLARSTSLPPEAWPDTFDYYTNIDELFI